MGGAYSTRSARWCTTIDILCGILGLRSTRVSTLTQIAKSLSTWRPTRAHRQCRALRKALFTRSCARRALKHWV